MGIGLINKEQLESALGRAIPDAYMLIAKNSVLGLEGSAIAEILGVEASEVAEIEETQDYRELRVHIAAQYSNMAVTRDLTWDEVESVALQNIGRRIEGETDIDTNLKVAAIANRAVRRYQSPVNRPLDAGAAGTSVRLNLTRRVIERMSSDGALETETVQEISLRRGEASNPTFAEIDAHLGVSARPRIPSNLSFRTSAPVPEDKLDLGALDRLMEQYMAKRR